MKLGELFMELGFKADTMKLKDFTKAIGELNMSSIIGATSFGALYEGAAKVVGIANDAAKSINKFGRETGQSTTGLQQWSKVAEQMGVSADTVANTFTTLQDIMFNAKLPGARPNEGFSILGLNPNSTTDPQKMMLKIYDLLKDKEINYQRLILRRMGIPLEALDIFAALKEKGLSVLTEQSVIDPEKLKAAAQLNASLVKTGQDLGMIWIDLGNSLIPTVDRLQQMADAALHLVETSKTWKNIMDGINNTLIYSLDKLEDLAKLVNSLRKNQWSEDALANLTIGHRSATEASGGWSNSGGDTIINAPVTVLSSDPERAGQKVGEHFNSVYKWAFRKSSAGGF